MVSIVFIATIFFFGFFGMLCDEQKVSGLQAQSVYTVSRSTHCLTCFDLLLSLSALGSYRISTRLGLRSRPKAS
jgi:hypothetical protein